MPFTIRLFDPAADVLRLLRLFNELEALDHDPEPSTEATIRSQLNWRGHNPAADRWVVEIPGHAFIGHGWVFKQTARRSALKVTVHPDYRRCGIGSALLKVALDRVREIGTPVAASGAGAPDSASVAFLEKHGFRAVSSNWALRAPASLVLPLPILPQGYRVCPYSEIKHPAALATALNRGYGDLPGHAENSQPITESYVAEAFATSRWDYRIAVSGCCPRRRTSRRFPT